MARNRGMYVDYGAPRGRRRRGPGLGTICGILIVIILAVLFGVMAYKVSGKNLDNLPGVPTPTPVPGSPTPTPPPTPTPTPTATPTPTPTGTPTPVPTSPETGLPCTPTPTPTPAWDDNYLVGWEDNRVKVNVKGAYTGFNLSKSENVEEILELAEKTELNAVVIDVKADTGKVTYQMDNAKIRELGICISQFSDMKGLLKTLVPKVTNIIMTQINVKIKRRYLLGKVKLSPLFFMIGLIYSSLQLHMLPFYSCLP